MLSYKGKALPRVLRNGFARILLSFIHRTPDRIADFKRRLSDDVEPLIVDLRRRYASGEDVGLPPGTSIDEAIVAIRRHSQTRSFAPLVLDLLNSKMLGNHIINMLWFIRELENADCRLLTSDKPVVHYNGISLRNGNIALALTPTMLFFATNNAATMQNVSWVSDSFLIKRFNHEVVRLATNFVYGDSVTQLPFIASRLKNPNPPSVPVLLKHVRPARQWYIPVISEN